MPNICGKNLGPGKKVPSFRTNCCGKKNTIQEPGVALRLPCNQIVFNNLSGSDIQFSFINCSGVLETDILPNQQISTYCGSQPSSLNSKVQITEGNSC